MSNTFVHSVKSRQKHRKLLGVGEDADGKIPRSKISQLLGNPVSNSVILDDDDYPIGLSAFQWVTCSYFTLISLMGLLSPSIFTQFIEIYYPNELHLAVVYNDNMKLMETIRNNYEEVTDDGQSFQQHFDNMNHFVETVKTQATLIYCYCCAVFSCYLVVIAIRYRNNRVATQSATILIAAYFIFEIVVCVSCFHFQFNIKFIVTNIWRSFMILLSGIYLFKMSGSTGGGGSNNSSISRNNDILKRE